MTNAVHVSSQGKQDYSTPWWFIKKVERRFGVQIIYDFAASPENKKAAHACYEDSLSLPWTSELKEVTEGNKLYVGWINPPFDDCTSFMRKCAMETAQGWRGVSLTLNSTGTGWFDDWVRGNAMVYVLQKRLIFEGCDKPYPKELIIGLWGLGLKGFGWWDFTEGMEDK